MNDILKPHLINYSMVFSPCQNIIAVSNNFNSIKILNLENGKGGLLKCGDNFTANVYNVKSCGKYLLCSSDCSVVCWSWKDIELRLLSGESIDCLWRYSLPTSNEFSTIYQIISMFVDESKDTVYVGCSDGVIHVLHVKDGECPQYVRCYRSNNGSVLSLTNTKDFMLIAGYYDGTVRFWDERLDNECMRIDTQLCHQTSRPKLGTSVNVVATDRESSDWVLCGGQTQLSLWNTRAKRVAVSMSTGNQTIDDNWIPFSAILRDETVISAGNSSKLYLWDLSGQLNSEIGLAGCHSVYDLLHREQSDTASISAADCNDFFLCGWGPCVELYSDIGYRKKIFTL